MKATGGGLFDPTARHISFGAGGYTRTGTWPPYTLAAVNELFGSDAPLLHRFAEGQTVLLDSGVFWLTNEHKRAHKGMSMDEALGLPPQQLDGFDKLLKRYVELAHTFEDRLWGYIELDQGGREAKRVTRAKLEDMGLRPIPVYHPLNDGWDYFDELASTYDRICVGNIVQASTALRARIIATIWERHRAHPELWIHGLGYTPNAKLHPYPFDSVDSSTWLAPLRGWANVGKNVATGLEGITGHPGHGWYALGDASSAQKAQALAAWLVHSATLQWQAHRAELDGLGIPALPARLPQEGQPCPSA